MFLDNLKLADKAAKDEMARTNKMGDSEVPKVQWVPRPLL